MGDGVFDADEAEAERVKAKAKLEKVRRLDLHSLHSGGRCRDGHLSRWLFYLSPLSIYRASSHVDLRRQRRTSRQARRPSSRLHCAGSVLAAANPAGMRHQQRGGEVVVESGMRRGIRARLHPWRRLCLRQGQRSTAPQH